MNDDAVAALMSGTAALIGGVFFIVMLAFVCVMVASLWMVFTKAGQPGWAAIVPIYNMIVLLQITGKPLWWFLPMCIPVVNFVIAIIVYIDLAKSFGKTAGFAIGILFLPFIFLPILGFGSARYFGPVSNPGGSAAVPVS